MVFQFLPGIEPNSEQNRIVSLGSKSSPTDASYAERAREARESYDWYSSITQELLAKFL